MHSLLTRANNVFFFGIAVLFALAFSAALTTSWMPSAAAVHRFDVAQLKSLRVQRELQRNGRRVPRDRAIVSFNLDAGA